ncbi:O-Antigen ligase [Gimesia alba]|uniref:O-Antigen ligase n=1 Tax=Gimesia alba TaxID=2527973 RepID=A0A517RD64_9PLAN|nr:O-antigen ligase family protein [Gimesia alba]QDT41827.1 O-Antigen ligase [Gimesia alba]
MYIYDRDLKRLSPAFALDSKGSFFKEQAYKLGVLLSIATGFAIPISTSLTSILSLGILVCWIISGQYRVSYELLKTNQVVAVSLAFFGFLAIGLLYTPESFSVASRNLFKYRQFIMIPVYLSFFLNPKSRRLGIQMFELALIVTLICSICCMFLPHSGVDSDIYNRTVFKNRITQNILMAFLVYLAAWKFWEKPKQRWYYAILGLVGVLNTVAIVPGRSGYLALGVLTCLFLCQKLGYKGLIAAAFCIGGIGFIAYHQSQTFQARINQVVTEVSNYQETQERRGGVNLRLEFYENSLQLAKSSPIVGAGIGSFELNYRQLSQEKNQIATANPHNEYVMLLVQNGAIGLCLFLSFYWVAWRSTRSMNGLDRSFGQAVLAVYVIGCLVNSLMLDTTEGNLFGFLMGLTLAGAGSAVAQHHQEQEPEFPSSNEDQHLIRDAA